MSVKLKLVPSTQFTCQKFDFAVTILETAEKRCYNFSSISLLMRFCFFDIER